MAQWQGRYGSDLTAFYDMVRSVCILRMDKREINPNEVRRLLQDPGWLAEHLPDYHRLANGTWSDWHEWCRLQFGWTPKAWAEHYDRLHPVPVPVDEEDPSLGVV